MTAKTDARKPLIKHATLFYQKGFMLGTAGNLSARSGADNFWITASGCDKGQLTPTDFVKVDLNGKLLKKFRENAKPSAETSIHSAIYHNYKDTSACYHVHSPESNIASLMEKNGILTLPAIEMLKGFGYFGKDAKIKVFENHDSVPEIAREISNYLQKEKSALPALLIKNHGVTVWAESQEKARNYVELIEYIFRYMVLQRMAF